MIEHSIMRGDCFFADLKGHEGNEIQKNRPCVVVSNDLNNAGSGTLEVVFLTTQPKMDLPTHTKVMCTGIESTALCEQITTIAKERIISSKIGECTEDEMRAIEDCIAVSLGLSGNFASEDCEEDEEYESDTVSRYDYDCVAAERNLYEKLYEELLDKAIGR